MAFRSAVAFALLAAVAESGNPFLVETCPLGTAIFDSAVLGCTTCGSSTRIPLNGTRDIFGNSAACGCPSGQANVVTSCDPNTLGGCAIDLCSVCPAGSAPAGSDSSVCLPCGNSTAGYDSWSGDCTCGALGVAGTHALVERSPTGSLLPAKECVACPNRTRVFLQAAPLYGIAASAYVCAKCADPHASMTATGECVCDAGYRAAGVLGVFPWATISCLPDTMATPLLTTYSEASAVSVSYYSVTRASAPSTTTSIVGKTSKAFQHIFAAAAVGCAMRKPGTNSDACQALANLCVLQLYDAGSTVCSLYTSLYNARKAAVNGFQGWPGSGLPFLYYGAADARSTTTDPALARTMSFDEAKEPGTSNGVEIYLAAYALNGTFLGLQRLRDQLAAYCDGAHFVSAGSRAESSGSWSGSPAAAPWLSYGVGYASSYTCDLSLLAASPLAKEPVFYDAYIRDAAADAVRIAAQVKAAAAGGGSSALSSAAGTAAAGLPVTLYPIPIAITNLRLADGSTPNVNSRVSAESNDVYVRRFTLAEAVSGITSPGSPSELLRYAAAIRVTFRARDDTAGRPNLLTPPLITVTYKERLTSELDAAAAVAPPGGKAAQPSVNFAADDITFAAEYTADNDSYGRTVLALSVSLGMLVIGWAFVRVTGWVRMNARNTFEAALSLKHLVKFGEYMVTTFAASYFWLLWAVTLYVLVFFKLQTAVFMLLPPQRPGYGDDPYLPFAAGLIAVFVCYLIRILLHLYRQGESP